MRPGQQLPSVLKLASEHECSVGTVRRALSTLAHEGILQSRRGSGVYVQEKPRQKIIGVMVPNVVNSDHAELVEVLSQGAAKRGYSPVLLSMDSEGTEYLPGGGCQIQFIERLAAMNAAGIIACPVHIPDEPKTRGRMRELRLPYVIINDYWTDCRRDHHVCVDQEAAARMAVDHLAGLGRREMVFCMFPGDEWPAAAQAFLDQLKRLACPAGKLSVAKNPSEWVAQIRAAGRPETPAAAVVPYREYALSLLAAATKAGLRVPEQLSLVGLGGLPAPKPHEADLTATISPIPEVAARALNIIIDGAEESTCHYRYMPTLHVGTTTAPAALKAGSANRASSPVSLDRQRI